MPCILYIIITTITSTGFGWFHWFWRHWFLRTLSKVIARETKTVHALTMNCVLVVIIITIIMILCVFVYMSMHDCETACMCVFAVHRLLKIGLRTQLSLSTSWNCRIQCKVAKYNIIHTIKYKCNNIIFAFHSTSTLYIPPPCTCRSIEVPTFIVTYWQLHNPV